MAHKNDWKFDHEADKMHTSVGLTEEEYDVVGQSAIDVFKEHNKDSQMIEHVIRKFKPEGPITKEDVILAMGTYTIGRAIGKMSGNPLMSMLTGMGHLGDDE